MDFIPLTEEAFHYCIKILKFRFLCKHNSLIIQILCDFLIGPKNTGHMFSSCSGKVSCNSTCLRISILFSGIFVKIPGRGNRKKRVAFSSFDSMIILRFY